MASRKKIPLFAISALKREGLKPLIEAVARTLDELAGKDGSGAPSVDESGEQA